MKSWLTAIASVLLLATATAAPAQGIPDAPQGGAPSSAAPLSAPPMDGAAMSGAPMPGPQAPTAPASSPPAGAGPASAIEQIPEYKLGAGDKVRIIVYGEPTLTGDYSVSGSGNISFPLIGDVPAADRTIRDIQVDIERKLANGYLRKPQVSAEVTTYRPYYILGEVNRPGQYPYTSGLTVLKAVATASGFTYRAQTKRVMIKRGDNAEEREFSLTTATPVAPGDIIRIKERMF